MKWEYSRLLARSERWSNPLDDEYIYEEMQILGKHGWELVAVSNDVAYFKRPKEDHGEEEAVKEAHSEEDTHQSQRCSTAGKLYTAAYHNAVNEDW